MECKIIGKDQAYDNAIAEDNERYYKISISDKNENIRHRK